VVHTGVWRFIKTSDRSWERGRRRMILPCHGLDRIELGRCRFVCLCFLCALALLVFSVFRNQSFVLMCNYLGHFVACRWGTARVLGMLS